MLNLVGRWGGSASMLYSLYRALRSAGHTVRVVSAQRDNYGMTTCELSWPETLTFGPEKRNGEVLIGELSSEELSYLANTAADQIEQEEFSDGLPDQIIANHINVMALTAFIIAKRFKIPYSIITHGTDTQLLIKDKRIADLFSEAARAASTIFTISKYVANQGSSVINGNFCVLGGAIDPEIFYETGSARKSSSRIIYVGRLVTEKGLWTLLDAIQYCRRDAELIIIGEGPLQTKLEAYIQTTFAGEKVRLLGYLPQERLRDLYNSAKIVVVPSVWQEPLGLVILEAFACGVPVVASSVGGIIELIRPGVNGLLVPPADPIALGNALDLLMTDRCLYAAIKQNIAAIPIPTYKDLAKRVITLG